MRIFGFCEKQSVLDRLWAVVEPIELLPEISPSSCPVRKSECTFSSIPIRMGIAHYPIIHSQQSITFLPVSKHLETLSECASNDQNRFFAVMSRRWLSIYDIVPLSLMSSDGFYYRQQDDFTESVALLAVYGWNLDNLSSIKIDQMSKWNMVLTCRRRQQWTANVIAVTVSGYAKNTSRLANQVYSHFGHGFEKQTALRNTCKIKINLLRHSASESFIIPGIVSLRNTFLRKIFNTTHTARVIPCVMACTVVKCLG